MPRLPACLRSVVASLEVDWVRQEVRLAEPLRASARAEIMPALATLEEALTPAGRQARTAQLARLITVFGEAGGSEAVMQQRWREYHNALNDLPADLLRLSVDRAIAECRFFPRPAELRSFVERVLTQRHVLHGRLSALARFRSKDPDADVAKPEAVVRKRQIQALLG